ncbi:type III restriction enzyme, res subunit [Candidatus Nitrosopumilus salaria BD31]|uniref:Type III restriction enzyme, res subunit n=1 Tax=Candidatus Nitrosopumilus salarius BD31 TaxID=859350 RepID=I3CZY4_9ARCH|nr:DEAD/DEAH box helicase family protein [Candidatus Nitrosopumilus salaria]EIJ65027.1 type III restriction enzyme, res subunit [Candidatus Nitrosopumilus salaria BD31]
MERFEPKLSWSSLKDNLIQEFYRPALKNAKLYQRKAGFFSSTSFMDITNEVISIIEKKGRIQLITSPKLSSTDIEIFQKSVEDKDTMISELCLKGLFDDQDQTKNDFRKLMAYMLVNEIEGHPQLEIKIALTEDGQGIFHEKLGIIYYTNNDIITFSGSVNETNYAWNRNIENFKVFCNWRGDTDKQAVDDDISSFNDLWEGNETKVRIYDLPQAVKEKLLETRPKSDEEFKEIFDRVCKALSIEPEELEKEKEGLRGYQKEAREKWLDNNFRGIFSMATGTGKTFTAFGCMSKFQQSEGQTVTVIACPQTHLVDQWRRESRTYNSSVPPDDQISLEREVTCYSDNPRWQTELESILLDFNEKLFSGEALIQNFVIYVTHKTLNSKKFKDYILSIRNGKKLLIVDEVHNIGSELSQPALLEEYECRLGLSATPIRHYDPEGTSALMQFFNNIVFDLSLKQAIDEGYLCSYDYFPYYAELNHDEMDVYDALTIKIAEKYSRKSKHPTDEDDQNDPEIKRANLIANAENKLGILEEILNSIHNIKQTLIYCTSNPSPAVPFGTPTQLDKVEKILVEKNIVSTSVTFRNPTKDRSLILQKLAVGHYDCITAVRCLDEGVDIPSVETAIIMASSGNPKQYIQRRGRVLRQSKKTGKTKAVIYDILVKPPLPDEGLDISKRERKLVAKELLRHKEFASIALNHNEAIETIRKVATKYKIDFESLDEEYIQDFN